MWKRLLLVSSPFFVVGLLLAPHLFAQPFPTPIAQAIALLTSGTTPFSIVGLNASGYINFNTGRSASGYGFRDNGGVIEAKNSGGGWAPLSFSGGAPSTATYITQIPDASLSAEQPLSALASALLLNTTTTGVVSAYGGSTCTNEVFTALSGLGVATCDPVTLTTMVTGTLPVANGGTGAATLTGIVQGNGTGAFNALTSSTIGQVLRVTGANAYAWGAVNFSDTDAITGTVPVANGGTGLTAGTSGGVLAYTASGTLASSGALTVSRIVLGGGAGAAPTVLGSLGTTTTVLHGNAAGAPTFAAVDIAADTTGTVPVARGGTNIASYAVGDLLFASGATTLSVLADVSVGSYLRSGGVTTAPLWSTAKLPNTATTGDLMYASGTNTYANLADVAVGSFLRSGGVAAVPVWSTTTWPNAATQGDVLVATGANAVGSVAAVATGRVFISSGTSTVPAWSVDPLSTTYTVTASFRGPGTIATTGDLRLQNTGLIAARNAADTQNITLLTSTSADRIQLGNTSATGLTLVASSNTVYLQYATDPTVSSGFGVAPTIAGVTGAFKVTVGGGGDTTGVVLFGVTWTTAPVCIANNETSAQLVRTTPTTTQVTLAGTLAAADVISVWCIGY